jgi:hypothetical protein
MTTRAAWAIPAVRHAIEEGPETLRKAISRVANRPLVFVSGSVRGRPLMPFPKPSFVVELLSGARDRRRNRRATMTKKSRDMSRSTNTGSLLTTSARYRGDT